MISTPYQGSHYVANIDGFVFNDIDGAGTQPTSVPGGTPLSDLKKHERCTVLLFVAAFYPFDPFDACVRFQRRYAFMDQGEFVAAAKLAEVRNKGDHVDRKDDFCLPSYSGPDSCDLPAKPDEKEDEKSRAKAAAKFWKSPQLTLKVYIFTCVISVWVLFFSSIWNLLYQFFGRVFGCVVVGLLSAFGGKCWCGLEQTDDTPRSPSQTTSKPRLGDLGVSSVAPNNKSSIRRPRSESFAEMLRVPQKTLSTLLKKHSSLLRTTRN